MRKLVAVATVLIAVHANAGSGSIVVCESMTVCRLRVTYQEYDIPTLTFNTSSGGAINTTANFWLSQDCSGDPDASFQLVDSPIPNAGYWVLPIDDWGVYPNGTDFSIQWTIDGCPTTACINGTTGSSPELCPF